MTAIAETSTKAGGSVIATRQTLLNALGMARRVVGVKNSKPVLNCVRLTVGGDTLAIEATDLNKAYRQTLRDVQPERTFVCLPNLEKLAAVLNAMASQTVTISLEGDQLRLADDDGSAKISVQAELNDFPPIPIWPDGNPDFQIGADALAGMYEQVRRGVGSVDSRFAMAGIHLSCNKLVMLESTDGRFAFRSTSLVKPTKKSSSVIAAAVFASVTAAASGETVIDCAVADNRVAFRADDFELFTAVIEGAFPTLDDVIAEYEDGTQAEVSIEGFGAAIKRVDAIDNGDLAFGVACTFGEKGIEIDSRGSAEKSETRYPCKVTGRELLIGFKPDRVLSLLASCPSETLKLSVTAANRPLQSTASSASGKFYGVLMPCNLS